ncbi:hypothetical protein [Microbacterium ulmi]|uniref:Uncharacterized protein n=1 Tax=Microbacterium ulmi TaxID=179095 RepID=A0A7Y2LZ62_9MICO|nr:hypothetical protein [Microbacterium ulmi]NII68411.1 hypothetical protein [Microbacterium ulmi]NNH03064.1 hypothetical protein [Microbacterium ulmi]
MSLQPDLYDLKFTFEKRYGEILGFQRLVLLGLPQALEQAWDDAKTYGNYAYDADEGDVDSVMHSRVPTTDDEVKKHLGIMLVVRAVALAEYTLAHIAATFFLSPEEVVFKDRKAWRWGSAEQFYSTALRQPFKLNAFGFNAISALRNYYAHSYGVFQDAADARQQQTRIAKLVGASEPSLEERNLRYSDSLAIVSTGSGWDQFAPVVQLGDLATFRLLEITKKTVLAAFDAASTGLLADEELARSKFVRRWQKDHTPQEQPHSQP